MAFSNNENGKEVILVQEFNVHIHECHKCGIVFSVMAMFLEDENNGDTEYWSSMSQTPKYCYMCGSLMNGDDEND